MCIFANDLPTSRKFTYIQISEPPTNYNIITTTWCVTWDGFQFDWHNVIWSSTYYASRIALSLPLFWLTANEWQLTICVICFKVECGTSITSTRAFPNAAIRNSITTCIIYKHMIKQLIRFQISVRVVLHNNVINWQPSKSKLKHQHCENVV